MSFVTEPEPFDWFATEKSIDLPLFDSVPSPLPPPQHCNRLHTNNVKHLHNYSSFPQAESAKSEQQQQYVIQQQQPHQHQLQQQEYMYDALPMHPSSSSSSSSSPYSSVTSSPTGDESSCSSDAGLTTVPLSPASNTTEWLKAETLTPPDSPKDEEILKLLREFQPGELEQLVMARVEDEFPSSLSGSPCSMSDDYLDSGASSPFVGSDSGMEDPEWTPPRRARTISAAAAGGSSCKRNGTYGEVAAATMMMPAASSASASRKRSKPYAKPAVEERKMRKKEQNKNAATRYRLKKKAEVEEVRFEERQLEEKNKLLRNQLEDISREVKYLKSLMRDVYRKKGLIK